MKIAGAIHKTPFAQMQVLDIIASKRLNFRRQQ
jgi:hypothetical protein